MKNSLFGVGGSEVALLTSVLPRLADLVHVSVDSPVVPIVGRVRTALVSAREGSIFYNVAHIALIDIHFG